MFGSARVLNLVNKTLPGLRSVASLVTGSGKRARLSILIYHRVLPVRDPLLNDEIDATAFDQQMAALTACFNVIPLSEAVDRLRAENLPPRAACVTFDDGYADNADIALPILQRHGIAATFFVSTGFLDGRCMWNDLVIESIRSAAGPELDLRALELGVHPTATVEQRREAIRRLLTTLKHLPPQERQKQVESMQELAPPADFGKLMMSPADVKRLFDSGMEIGAHTVSHPILNSLTADAARSEISVGRDRLQEITGSKIDLFAYPNGKPGDDYSRSHVDMLKQLGFKAGLTTAWGVARFDSDPYQLPRFTPWDTTPIRFTARLLQNAALHRSATV